MSDFKMNILDFNKRLISGWASVEVVDRQGQYVPVEEMTKAMIEYMDRGGLVFYGHENKPVGKVLYWDVREHPDTGKAGIYIIAKINRGYKLDDVVWNGIKEGKLKGFSIAGLGNLEKQLMKSEDGSENYVDVLKDIELTEISVVETPANPYALIDEVNVFAKSYDNDVIAVFSRKEDAYNFANDYGFKVIEDNGKYLVVKSDGVGDIGGIEQTYVDEEDDDKKEERREKRKNDVEGVEGIDMELGKGEGTVTTAIDGMNNSVYGDKVTSEKNKVGDEEEGDEGKDEKEEIEKAIRSKKDLIRILRGVLKDAKKVKGFVDENTDSNAYRGMAEDIVKTLEALIDELEEDVITVSVEKQEVEHVRDLGRLLATFDDKELAEEYAKWKGGKVVPTKSGRWAVILEEYERMGDTGVVPMNEVGEEVMLSKADAPTKAEMVDKMKKYLEKIVETSAQKQEIPSLVEWIWLHYVENRDVVASQVIREIADRLDVRAQGAKKAWEKFYDDLKKVREAKKNESKKGVGADGYRILGDITINVEKALQEFAEPNDVRPPKDWLERKVKELQEEQGLDKESATRLAAWIYWHWVKPNKPKGKDEPDRPDTKEARQRKRKWLNKDIDLGAVANMDAKQLIMEGLEEEANAVKIYIAMRNRMRELGYGNLADWIDEIIGEELEHLEDFENMLKLIDPEGYADAEGESMNEMYDYLVKAYRIRKKLEILKAKKKKSDKEKKCLRRYKDPNQSNRFKEMTCPDDASEKNRFCGCVRAMMNCRGMSLEQAKRICGYIKWYVKKSEIKKKIERAKRGF